MLLGSLQNGVQNGTHATMKSLINRKIETPGLFSQQTGIIAPRQTSSAPSSSTAVLV